MIVQVIVDVAIMCQLMNTALSWQIPKYFFTNLSKSQTQQRSRNLNKLVMIYNLF